jgi:hypothetical protein
MGESDIMRTCRYWNSRRGHALVDFITRNECSFPLARGLASADWRGKNLFAIHRHDELKRHPCPSTPT